ASTPGRSAALDTSRWAMKKSGFADWNTTTFTDGSASSSVISAPNSTIVAGPNMLIGGLLKVIVHRPGEVRSMLNCEESGMRVSCVDLADRLGVEPVSGHGRRAVGRSATGSERALPAVN